MIYLDINNINTDRDTSGLGPIEYDQSNVPSLIRKHADNVRTKTYGQDVREAMARNAEVAGLIANEANDISKEARDISTDTQNRFDDQISGSTDINEVIDARRPSGSATAYPTLNERIDGQFGEYVAFADGKHGRTIAGVLRRSSTSDNWQYIDDTTHQPVNLSTLTVVNDNLEMAHSFTATKIGGLSVTPDETMTAKGVTVGASVGTTKTLLSFYAPISAVIIGNGTVQYGNEYTKSLLNIENLEDGSGLKINHPTVSAGLGDVPSVSEFLEQGNGMYNSLRFSYNTNFVQVQHYDYLNGLIEYNTTTSSWVYTTSNIEKPTIAFSNGDLTLTYTKSAPLDNFAINLSARSRYLPIIKSATQTTIVINFIDTLTGNVVTSPNNTMRCHLSRDVKVLSTMPTNTRFSINRGAVKVPASQMITGTTGNFWITGIMQD